MRITSRMMVDNAIQHMEDSLERLSALQERAASGKLIRNPSDDPSVATAGLNLRSTLNTNAAYLDTARVSADWLDANELALKTFVDIGARALTLTKQGLSDTQGAAERQALGVEMDGLLQNAVEAGNSSQRGNYLFAGFKVTTLPYTYTGAGVTNNLASTADLMQHGLEPGQTVTVNIDGNTLLTPFFAALVSARDALNTNNPSALQTALTSLQTAFTGVADARTTNGARQRQVQTAIDRLENTQLLLKDLLSHKEDASLAETISLLKHQETVYQAVLGVGQRALPPSLFDFLK
jgi:flagellar hook-associated protein 3 FlgL